MFFHFTSKYFLIFFFGKDGLAKMAPSTLHLWDISYLFFTKIITFINLQKDFTKSSCIMKSEQLNEQLNDQMNSSTKYKYIYYIKRFLALIDYSRNMAWSSGLVHQENLI